MRMKPFLYKFLHSQRLPHTKPKTQLHSERVKEKKNMARGGGAGATTVLMMMVVVFGMVAGQQVSALQTSNDFIDCFLKCKGDCPWWSPAPACALACGIKCESDQIPKADVYCHMGCITSTCITTDSPSNSVDNEACVKGCGKICGSSTPTYKFGRNPVV